MSRDAESKSNYNDLIQLFYDFRKYQEPPVADGVHDYSIDVMKEQERRLPEFRARLDAIDTAEWTIAQKVDFELVKAEMNGLEFDHRTLRPWERDPSFYSVVETGESDVPAREAPRKHDTLRLFACNFPLEGEERADFDAKIRAIPGILDHAKKTLIPKTKELFYLGIIHKNYESHALKHLAEQMKEIHPEIVADVERAGAAVDDFADWLKQKHSSMEDSYDGIGVEEYNWYQKNVHLVPYTWEEQRAIIQRELERSWTCLKMEEHRNRNLPPLCPPETVEEMQERVKNAYPEYMDFLRDQDIFSVPDYMHLSGGNPRRLVPEEHRDIFVQCEYHSLIPLRCHMVHWLEKQRELHNTHPIRKEPLLYNIWDSRAEGFATAFEETMLQAGMMDHTPRAREVVYILLAFRAARAIGDLRMQSCEWKLQDAIDFSAKGTPRGWLKADGHTIVDDLSLYLRQPGYGTSYVVGKIQFEQLLADRAMQLGDDFTLKSFLDEYFAMGMIPASLIRWEMTGLDDEMKRLKAR